MVMRALCYRRPARMVISAVLESAFLAATEEGQPVIEPLDTKERAFVLLTLLTLILVGFLLALFIIIGGRWARRQARWNRRPRVFGGSAGAKNPKHPPGRPAQAAGQDQDPIHSAETRIDNGSEETQQSDD